MDLDAVHGDDSENGVEGPLGDDEVAIDHDDLSDGVVSATSDSSMDMPLKNSRIHLMTGLDTQLRTSGIRMILVWTSARVGGDVGKSSF